MKTRKAQFNHFPDRVVIPSVKLTAKCITGHKEVLTQAQIEEAQKFGVAMCSKCGKPMVVERASA